QINILGASIGSLVCYGISMVPNLYYVHKYTGLKPDPVPIFFKPLLASIAMTGVLYLLMSILPQTRLITIGLIFVGAAVYAVVSILIGSIQKDEFAALIRRLKK
ncbi:MAG TPA: polysaccharide biosynthesis C-terminal domain-containing protein, partial [Candidatus Limiplasma sp.]|nr:polysaccharide biosynthesis C-terminal domain-containing protein [Candidatus Limiplasma sp.]